MKTKPYNRHETFLAALTDSAVTVPTPLTREERYLAKIAGESVTIPEAPYNRYETYLAKLAGQDVTVPTPASRLEVFLYKACGYDCDVPIPANREEVFWARYVGSEATGGSVMINDAAAGSPRSFVVHVEPVQAGEGDPTPDNIRDISGWDEVVITDGTSAAPIYSAPFASTVYAGTIDVMTGNVVSTHKLYKITARTSWSNNSTRDYFYRTLPSDSFPVNNNAEQSTGLCDRSRLLTGLDLDAFVGRMNVCMYSNKNVGNAKTFLIGYFKYDGVTVNTLAKLQSYIDNGGFFTLLYRLETPSEQQLTPATITLAPGSNTFTCNCGTITLKYTPDL